jgi:hypothetical protein
VSVTQYSEDPELAVVSLVEDQVQDVKHRVQPIPAFAGRRHPELGAGGLDPLLCAADALGHGCQGDQEGTGDLCGARYFIVSPG